MSCAGPRRFSPGCLARLFANPRTVSGNPENRDSGAAHPAGPASSVESCLAVLRDAEAAPLPAIPRAPSWRRSDTWLPPAQKSLPAYCTQLLPQQGVTREVGEEILRGVCRGRHEFITRDSCRNARSAVLGGLDTHNLSQAADIYIARPRDLLWKSNDELNFAANFEIGISKEIESAVTDIPRVGVHLASLRLPRVNPHW